jgi:hypothetical protein
MSAITSGYKTSVELEDEALDFFTHMPRPNAVMELDDEGFVILSDAEMAQIIAENSVDPEILARITAARAELDAIEAAILASLA